MAEAALRPGRAVNTSYGIQQHDYKLNFKFENQFEFLTWILDRERWRNIYYEPAVKST